MASTKIDIIANNKASAALGKVNRDVKKIETSGRGMNDNFRRMKGLVVAVGAALGGIKIAGSFLQTATQLENLDIQLKFITGSAKEGAKAFDIVTKAASSSAFSLEQMANASPLLLTVADSTEELNSLLAMTGDIAAATGLSYEETAGQLQRAMSGGIASADLFREKGVKSMLGFQEGVQYTAEETARMIKEGFENSTFSIAGAGEEMAGTFKGQMGMMNDAWFTFKKTVMENGVFPALKTQLGDLRGFLDTNKEQIDAIAVSLGEGIAKAIGAIATSIKFIAEHSEAFGNAAKILIAIKLASWMFKAVAALRAMFIGLTAVLGLTGPAGWAVIASGIAAVTVATLTMNKALGATEEVLSGDELQAKIKATKDRINELAEANGKYETQLKDLTPYKNFASEVDHLSSGFSLLEDKILPMPDLYDGVVQSMSKNSAESMLLKGELEQLELLYSNLAETVETETIPAIDEIVHNFNESQKVIGLNTDMLTKLEESVFSVHDEMSKNFIPTITVSTDMLTKLEENVFSVHDQMSRNFIPTITVATGHLSFMKKEVFSVHDEMSKNFIPTISVGTGMLTKMKNEGFSPTTEMAKAFNRVIQVSTGMLSHNAVPAYKSAIEIMSEMKRVYKTSTDFLSHNAIPVEIRATDIMGKTFDALKKKKDALEAAAKAQKELTAVEEANYKTQFDAFKAGKFAEMDLTKLTEKQKLKFVKDGARTALGQLAQHNKAAFMINKAFAIKDAIVSTSQGVVKALSMGPLGIPLAMIIGAMGVAQIATIASQSYSGRRYGGPVSNDQSYMVGENGPELFTPGATGRITANGSGSKKPVNINFNITATDASSIDELLVARRGMIINMVRQATQERGNQPNF